MKRLPQAKQNQLIGVLAGTLVLTGAVYMLLISPQNNMNHSLNSQIEKERARLDLCEKAIKQVATTTNTLNDVLQQLGHAEDDLASGDPYAWAYEKIFRGLKSGYKLEVPAMGQPSLGDCDLISGLPYKQIRFQLNGTAFYHDVGKFVADFENKFPHCRVLNLSLETPMVPSTERLNFRMDIVALDKPN